MTITDIRIRKFDTPNKLKAIASITIDDAFVIHDVKVLESEKGLFVGMPSKKAPSGKFVDIAHPIKTEVREMIVAKVIEKYNETTTEPQA